MYHLDAARLQDYVTSNYLTAGPAVSYSGFKQPVRLPPPTLGQHTSEVLQDLLHYDCEELKRLKCSACI